MPLKTILFLVGFAGACLGALFYPIIGIVGYMMHYQMGPEGQWWAEDIRGWGIRYSYLLAIFTAAGVAINFRKLRYGANLLTFHEWILVAFVGVVWLSVAIGLPSDIPDDLGDYAPLKLTKVLLFALIVTHVVTSPRAVDILLWTFVAGAFFLGYQAYTAHPWEFRTGRLNGIGGPDFREANALSVYLGACLPIIGVQFMRTGWAGKLVCLAAGVLTVNGVILTQSRGGTIAVAAGAVAALVTAPKQYRKIILIGLIVASIGGYALTNAAFWERTVTVTADEDQRDASAQNRVNIWRASLGMLGDHPLGVGAGNFTATIGRYDANYIAADAHSTFVRCYSELGVHGFILFLIMLGSAARVLWQVRKRARALPKADGSALVWASYAMGVSLAIICVGGATNTHLYLENTYWFIAIPVCLWRSLENTKADLAKAPAAGLSPRQPKALAALGLGRKGRTTQ